MDAAHHLEQLADARLCVSILDAWGRLSDSSRRARFADLETKRLTVETILLLPRPERERLLLAIKRAIAAQDVLVDAPDVLDDDEFAEFDKYKGRRNVPYPDCTYSWGGMGYWPNQAG